MLTTSLKCIWYSWQGGWWSTFLDNLTFFLKRLSWQWVSFDLATPHCCRRHFYSWWFFSPQLTLWQLLTSRWLIHWVFVKDVRKSFHPQLNKIWQNMIDDWQLSISNSCLHSLELYKPSYNDCLSVTDLPRYHQIKNCDWSISPFRYIKPLFAKTI